MSKADIDHKRFIAAYIRFRFNGVKAYRHVYGKNLDVDSARASASRLLSNVNIRKAINKELEAFHLSTEEALEILSTHARSDMSDFTNEDGEIDIKKLKEAGLGHLIKEVETIETVSDKGSFTKKKVKLHDPQTAINMILRVQGKFKDTLDLNVNKVIKVSIGKNIKSDD